MAAQKVVQIKFTKSFQKQFQKILPKLQSTFFDRLEIFKNNPFQEILNNHSLRGQWAGFRSINVSGDYRAIYEDLGDSKVKFHAIGTHSQLYG